MVRRSGGWAYRVDAGFHPETGKRRQTLKQGFATKKAAEAALAETLRDRSVKEDRLFVTYVLLATTGMGRGEVLGLRRSDVDVDGSQLAVATLTTVGSELVMGPPKTPRSRRHVYLDAQTLATVRGHLPITLAVPIRGLGSPLERRWRA